MGAYAPIEVGCEAYIVRSGKLLLGKRKRVFGDGTWGLPGGRIEFLERADDAIIRELQEELAVTVTTRELHLIAVTDDPSPDRGAHHLHLTFAVDIGNQEPQLNEPYACSDWQWYSLTRLPRPLFPPHAKILATINSGQVYLKHRRSNQK